jgi:hypothetical protein
MVPPDDRETERGLARAAAAQCRRTQPGTAFALAGPGLRIRGYDAPS